MNNSHVLPAIVAPLILWRVYRRVRRNVGRQKFSEKRSWVSIVLISLLCLLIGWGTWQSGGALWPLGAGLAGGLILTVISHQLTRFEHVEDGSFYTPNPYLGVAVSLLLIGRLIYRFLLISQASDFASARLGQSPLTVALFGLTFGYYLASAVFLMYEFRWSKKSPASGQN